MDYLHRKIVLYSGIADLSISTLILVAYAVHQSPYLVQVTRYGTSIVLIPVIWFIFRIYLPEPNRPATFRDMLAISAVVLAGLLLWRALKQRKMWKKLGDAPATTENVKRYERKEIMEIILLLPFILVVPIMCRITFSLYTHSDVSGRATVDTHEINLGPEARFLKETSYQGEEIE